jgi:hypothetical protein
MKVDVKHSPNVLIITQRTSAVQKAVLIFALLAFGGCLPGLKLFDTGTGATLSCAREAGAGVVCTHQMSWLGVFRRTTRYEHVQRAEIETTSNADGTYYDLKLISAAGSVVFGSRHDYGFIGALDQINALIDDPAAPPLAVRHPIDATGVVIWGGIVLIVIYMCLASLMWTGSVTVFNAIKGEVRVRHERFLGPKIRTLPLNAILNVYVSAESHSMYAVYLSTANVRLSLCWFTVQNSLDPMARAELVAGHIRDWLAPHHQAAGRRFATPAPDDLVEVPDPLLAYLLSHSASAAVVIDETGTFLRIDLLGGPPYRQRLLRQSLAALKVPGVSARRVMSTWSIYELINMCHVDVAAALKAADWHRRDAIEEMLREPEPPPSSD